MDYRKIIALYTIGILISVIIFTLVYIENEDDDSNVYLEIPTVKINIHPHTIIYEGDIIDCTITGNPTIKYWAINNQKKHTTFYDNNPIIFDPEPTPLNTNYVKLTVYVENSVGNASDTVWVIIKRIYFGDIHWHSTFSDGLYDLDQMYQNAIADKYLDFASCTDHAVMIDLFKKGRPSLIRALLNRILGNSEWEKIKNKAVEYYEPGNFTTLLGFEWTASNLFPGGWKWSPNGHEDVCHINFYYKDIYPNALKYSALQKLTFDDIFQAMAEEWDKGHLNIGFPHHPIAIRSTKKNLGIKITLFYNTNWSFLARGIKNTNERNKILRGAEVYSRWGTAIGQFSNIPITWSYPPSLIYDIKDCWVENGMWEWSESPYTKGQKYVLMASSDTHHINRPGSADLPNEENYYHLHPAGIMGAFAVHNTREEIWDAMNDCDIYGSQLLKMRANVRFDGQMAYGRWINCSYPLNITITAQSTFVGSDSSGKNMCPHGFSLNELDYPIQDIWLIKKDRDRGRPWCKVINHLSPNSDIVAVNFTDYDVQPNDFYYVAIRQKGQELKTGENEYMAFIGPVFIDNIF